MRESIQDGKLHRRHTHLRNDTSVDEFDERVNHALRVDDNFDSIIRKTEQKMRFDDFERLVSQGRAIDGDLATHLPGWVSERILDRR